MSYYRNRNYPPTSFAGRACEIIVASRGEFGDPDYPDGFDDLEDPGDLDDSGDLKDLDDLDGLDNHDDLDDHDDPNHPDYLENRGIRT